ncbi:RNA polymerase sigma factor, partial [Pseudomonas sp. EA_65y_Pfl1_P113]|uniref:RNA polymerase sigma factor n=2 Tax=Pseudomonadota TaxID=1224 RepID=UPI0030DB1AE0
DVVRCRCRQPIAAADVCAAWRWNLALEMDAERHNSGLQLLIVNERARLLRFLAVRGAGDEAEDVLQDLWQRVALSTSQPVVDPISYLFRAAENLMRDRHRSNVSRVRRQQDWHSTGDTPQDVPGGERVLIARQRLREADAVLAALGPRVDRVFRSYRLEGESQASIAKTLGVSLSSVEKDLQKAYRALAALKVKLDAE